VRGTGLGIKKCAMIPLQLDERDVIWPTTGETKGSGNFARQFRVSISFFHDILSFDSRPKHRQQLPPHWSMAMRRCLLLRAFWIALLSVTSAAVHTPAFVEPTYLDASVRLTARVKLGRAQP
jgi:hypothetical protein